VDDQEMNARLAPMGIGGVRPLSGGASSLTFAATMGGEPAAPVVVKVAPPGVAPILNRDMLRQARMLRALRPTGVPVPEVVFEDGGDPPDVPPLYVMRFVEGASFEPLFDRGPGVDAGVVDAAIVDAAVVGDAVRNAARTLAVLHALDPDDLGLGTEPRVGPAEEVERWCRLLETVDQALVAGWPDVAARLRAAEPAPTARPSVVHGDFRLGNLLTAGGSVVAVVDWEIWTVGDPRVDLGWFLANCDPATYRRATGYETSVPPLDDIIEAYATAGGPSTADLPWFRALACFKSTATWSLIVKHNRRRPSPDPELEEMAGALPGLLEQAADLIG
jgi:aminoglycoside phosphotransferase (APT) family kinase protein